MPPPVREPRLAGGGDPFLAQRASVLGREAGGRTHVMERGMHAMARAGGARGSFWKAARP